MTYDLVVVGTGFASSFFLLRWLERAPATARVLVLERGGDDPHAWQVREQRPYPAPGATYAQGGVGHRWVTPIGFGGGSNCWWACTPRFLPNDLRLRSTYGVGTDWPITYDQLEPYYGQAEAVMGVSGACDGTPYPMSTPYPQPPHRLNGFDRALSERYPQQVVPQPTARARVAGARNACRSNGVCTVCPLDAKFTIRNGMSAVYQDPRVTRKLHHAVRRLQVESGRVAGVVAVADGQETVVAARAVALGAGAMFNPHLLLASGVTGPWLGQGLHEQLSLEMEVELDGLDSFDGSTSITGHFYGLYDGPHRSERAAVLVESSNIPVLRTTPGRWRQRARLKFIVEDLPQAHNRVELDPTHPSGLRAHYEGPSPYAIAAVDHVRSQMDALLSGLPVSSWRELYGPDVAYEAHVLGTTRMGTDAASSVVDAGLVHHQLRNLWVLGSGAFPTGSAANPSLTIAALSLWAADQAEVAA